MTTVNLVRTIKSLLKWKKNIWCKLCCPHCS